MADAARLHESYLGTGRIGVAIRLGRGQERCRLEPVLSAAGYTDEAAVATCRDVIAQTKRLCLSRIQKPPLATIADELGRRGVDADASRQLVAEVTADPRSQARIVTLKAQLADAFADDSTAFERYLLVNAAVRAMDQLEAVPVVERVKRLLCGEFEYFGSPDERGRSRLLAGQPAFAEHCKTATLRRFPAGQFDWEVAGISRSDLMRVHPRALVPAIWFAAARMGGLGPVFFSHLNPRRPNRSLSEEESNRSYYLMARSLELQPHVKGFAGCSWFRSPDVQRVSPHLAWISRVFLENGGLVVQGGAADPDCGVLYRSATRKRLYEEGRFKPTVGLVMWPRAAMIEWARRHGEYE